MTQKHVQAESWYMPDTTLHPLNGEYVVFIDDMKAYLVKHGPYLAPDDAEAFAASLTQAAALARQFRESGEEEETQ